MQNAMLISMLSMFAGPLGNLLTTAIASGSAAFVTYATAKGLDTSLATQIAVTGAGVAAALVNWGAGMLGVKVNVINGPSSGNITVVKASDATKAGVSSVDPTASH